MPTVFIGFAPVTVTANSLYTLPNGVAVAQRNRYETDFVYREVFVEQIYTRDFADLPAAPVVVDVGLNIGLFALFVARHYPGARVLGFEPSPDLFALAEQNLAAFPQTRLFRAGLGARAGEATFTYYPNYSLLSGFHGDAEADRELLAAGIVEQLQHKEDADAYLALLTDGKLDGAQRCVCAITTLSRVMADESLAQIDLLKIDAEKAELDVLHGIADNDWSNIRRIVLEAHSCDSADECERLLRARGYAVTRRLNARHARAEISTLSAQRLP